MNLTFKGFLRGYCQELAGNKTACLKTLVRAAASDAPRVAEPLLLFATLSDKTDYLLELARGTWMEQGYREVAMLMASRDKSPEALLGAGELPPRYQRVWQAYRAKHDAVQSDRRVSGLMREKTLAALQASNTTCYRLCKDLGLNKGNVYAYLSKGDTTKVSRKLARTIMTYAEQQARELPAPC